jgi:hypothetical protein
MADRVCKYQAHVIGDPVAGPRFSLYYQKRGTKRWILSGRNRGLESFRTARNAKSHAAYLVSRFKLVWRRGCPE